MDKRYYCDWCSTELGEVGCSNHKGGSYCSVQCADADEDVTPQPATLDAEEVRLDPEKVVDMFTALTREVMKLRLELVKKDAQQQREIDRLKQLTEENAKNTLTFAEELERMKHKAEHTQNQTSHVDLVTEFLLEDIGVLAEKLGKLGAMKRRDGR